MNDMILILNYSDEFSVEIARRLRVEQVYSRILPGDTSAQRVRELAPMGVILSGEAAGDASGLDKQILELGIPVLALGHAAHMLLACMGGASAGVVASERKALMEYGDSALFAGITGGERYLSEVRTLMLPPDLQVIASAAGCTIAFEHGEKKQFGVQFELERNDPEGSAMLKNFARDICGCSPWWSLDAALNQAESVLADAAKGTGHALCAVSGGVDSTVAALLAHRAFGERMTAVFVDTGLMRAGEPEAIRETFEALGVPLLCVDCSGEIMNGLCACSAKERRAVVTGVLHEELIRRSAAYSGPATLVLGTNYSDFLNTGSSSGEWADSGMRTVEPLLELFKEEVRAIALRLGIEEQVAARKPFPVLGLAARIVGEITPARLESMRLIESIFREEIQEAGMERKLYKYFPVLVGMDEMFGGEIVVLRAVTLSGSQLTPARLPYDLVERTVQRVKALCPTVVRVFYDQTISQLGQESFF